MFNPFINTGVLRIHIYTGYDGMIKYNRIVVAGTPGVGKTTVAKLLASRLNALHIDLSKLALEKKLYSHYDEERQSYVIDEYRVVEEVGEIIKSNPRVIIDTHYPEILPGDLVDVVIVLRVRPDILEERLKTKNWPLKKIRENVLAEILSVVSINAIQRFGDDKVYEINTTGLTVEDVVEKVMNILENPEKHKRGIWVDWLVILPPEEITKYSV